MATDAFSIRVCARPPYRPKGECRVFDNQNLIILIVVLVIALVIGLLLVSFVFNNSDSETDEIATTARVSETSPVSAVVAMGAAQQAFGS
jgi:flagellar basal body-associated protein FliL